MLAISEVRRLLSVDTPLELPPARHRASRLLHALRAAIRPAAQHLHTLRVGATRLWALGEEAPHALELFERHVLEHALGLPTRPVPEFGASRRQPGVHREKCKVHRETPLPVKKGDLAVRYFSHPGASLHKKPLKPPQLPAVSPVAGSLVRKKAS